MIIYNLHSFFDLTYSREVGQNYRNIFVGFLVQMKTSKSHFEINWPLAWVANWDATKPAIWSWLGSWSSTLSSISVHFSRVSPSNCGSGRKKKVVTFFKKCTRLTSSWDQSNNQGFSLSTIFFQLVLIRFFLRLPVERCTKRRCNPKFANSIKISIFRTVGNCDICHFIQIFKKTFEKWFLNFKIELQTQSFAFEVCLNKI